MAPSGAGEGFDVNVPGLIGVAGRLRSRGEDVGAAGARAAGSARDAAGSCGGGPLQGALDGLSAQLAGRCDLVDDVLTTAGAALERVGAAYQQTDVAAATRLGAVTIPGLP